MSNYPTEIIGHVAPLPRIDLSPQWKTYPDGCRYPTCNCDPRCFMSQPPSQAECERIWAALVATAESSNMGTGQ